MRATPIAPALAIAKRTTATQFGAKALHVRITT